MILVLKIWLACFLYDWFLVPITKAFIKVSIKHIRPVRVAYYKIIHYCIRKGYVKIDEGDEYERRQRIKVGDLMLVKSAEFGDEVTICTDLDMETMAFKFSDRYFKVLGYAER